MIVVLSILIEVSYHLSCQSDFSLGIRPRVNSPYPPSAQHVYLTHRCLREQPIYDSRPQEACSSRDKDGLVVIVIPHFVARMR